MIIFVTFGQRYGAEKHPFSDQIHKNGWVEINYNGEDDIGITEEIKKLFGNDWANYYTEENFHPEYFPRGCLLKIEAEKTI